jgi:tetratricopeptide (TPR) repeat protein
MKSKFIFYLIFLGSISFFSCKNNEKQYLNLVSKADSLYLAKDFDKAKLIFLKVFDVKSGDKYAIKKINEIDSILIVLNKKLKYKEVINKANNLFEKESYTIALQTYKNALRIMPKDNFAIKRIKDLQFLIEAQKQEVEIVSNNPYHIIVGSFVNERYAQRLRKKLLKEGYDAQLITRPFGGFKAVSYTSYSNIHEAFNDLKNAKNQIHRDSWVLFQENK